MSYIGSRRNRIGEPPARGLRKFRRPAWRLRPWGKRSGQAVPAARGGIARAHPPDPADASWGPW